MPEPLTFKVFSPLTALIASRGLDISTKPKPYDFPVLASFTTTQESTFPYALNKSRTSASVTKRSILRTKIFMLKPEK